jgi:subtilase family serine protease
MNYQMESVSLSPSTRQQKTVGLCFALFTLIACAALPALAAEGKFIEHNTPQYAVATKSVGTENPSKVIEVSVWLNLHNREELDALAHRLYDRNSSDYRHFLNRAQIATRFAPTAEEAKTVSRFLESHNLKVVKVGPDNFFVHARGTVGDIENAFHVQLNKYVVQGKVVRANDRDPYIEGAAAPLVRTVAGLDSGKYEHPALSRPTGFGKTKVTTAAAAVSVKSAASDFFTNNCFDGTKTETFSTNSNGSLPIGTYSGNHINLQTVTSAGCGYTPPMIQAAYNLTGLYAEGFDGTGQTIGIIDWCGSLTIQNDANAFSTMFGLPQLTSSNFAITYIPRPSTCQATDQVEINIDVEWAHAIAPGANINLIVPPSATFLDVDEAEFTAVNYGLANVLSGSFGSAEAFTPPGVLANENLINEIAAVSGISANFSTGDAGDFTIDGIPATVSAPADSPWATAVGGVTLALNPDNSIAWQAGWGNNEVLLANEGFIPDPPEALGFVGGAGGGPANCTSTDSNGNCLTGYAKPSYQKGLPGKFRLLPDVAWLADPFTGAVIAITVPGNVPSLLWQVWGGTSVACPMFSALWAIANQEAGSPLGQAAPYLYSLPAGAVTDIVPYVAPHNVVASIQEPTVTNKYGVNAVLGGSAPAHVVSALWDYPFLQDTLLVLSFGTDCDTLGLFSTPCTSKTALHTSVGWDNVTGVGTPNAQAFADSFHPAAAPKK